MWQMAVEAKILGEFFLLCPMKIIEGDTFLRRFLPVSAPMYINNFQQWNSHTTCQGRVAPMQCCANHAAHISSANQPVRKH